MSREKDQAARENVIKIFKNRGGILRTKEALDAGIHPRILYELRDAGRLEKLETGLYALTGLPGISDPDLVTGFPKKRYVLVLRNMLFLVLS